MDNWKPVSNGMLTSWSAEVSPDNVWQEYPRPQMKRSEWTNLNGLWNYAVTPAEAAEVTTWTEQILVPFCPESALSGVGRLIEPHEALWYRRNLPNPDSSGRTLIHFEAVDYETKVWVNGTEMGTHIGGHTPFSFDLTDVLEDSGNTLTLRVIDRTEDYQLHGKQKLENQAIWYTRVTGIWQTVWLEQVPERHFTDLNFACDIHNGTIEINPVLAGPEIEGERIRFSVEIAGKPVASAVGNGPQTLAISSPQLWSPGNPALYRIKADILDDSFELIDSVQSYTALREYGKSRDTEGHLRFTLNGESIFHWGPLDQGWWPDGLLTPPSDEAMRSDIEFLKAAGFNMIRKHIKVEPRRYYYHCDQIGMLMWQDQVSSGYGRSENNSNSRSAPWTRMQVDPVDALWPDDAHRQWMVEYRRMVDHLRNHPCIAVWVPFNEAWGQHRTMEVAEMAATCDPTRPINIASGGNFWPTGDIADHHSYPDPKFPLEDERFADYIKVVGEFGGHGWPVPDHLWSTESENWGYGGLPKDLDEWKARYARSIDIVCELRDQGIAASVYTQTSDVEVEINGLLTYDRIRKVNPDWLREQSERVIRPPPKLDTP